MCLEGLMKWQALKQDFDTQKSVYFGGRSYQDEVASHLPLLLGLVIPPTTGVMSALTDTRKRMYCAWILHWGHYDCLLFRWWLVTRRQRREMFLRALLTFWVEMAAVKPSKEPQCLSQLRLCFMGQSLAVQRPCQCCKVLHMK